MNDGVILAADSAATFVNTDGSQHVYNNANKITNLVKGLPIGAISWGAGGIGMDAMPTLMKDLRVRLSGDDPGRQEWRLDRSTYTMEQVALRVKEFFFDERYAKSAAGAADLGIIVAGYSAGASMAEEYAIEMNAQGCQPPRLLRPMGISGTSWAGQPEALNRLFHGFSPRIAQVLEEKLGVPHDQISDALGVFSREMAWPSVVSAMPFQDAIDLAEFMVDLTIKFCHFGPGAPVVGGPIEIAAISRHEGFKWIRRKHYFRPELNPEVHGHV